MRLLNRSSALVGRVVVFTNNNARVIVNLPRKDLKILRTYLENPDFDSSKGYSSSFFGSLKTIKLFQ